MAFPKKISDPGSVACRRVHADGPEGGVHMRTPTRFGWLVLLLSALFALLVPSMAQAQANVFRFEFQEPLPDSTALPECLPPDLVGTQTGTETTLGQVTETGKTFQVHAGVPGRLPGRTLCGRDRGGALQLHHRRTPDRQHDGHSGAKDHLFRRRPADRPGVPPRGLPPHLPRCQRQRGAGPG